jgi:hypothetical protein
MLLLGISDAATDDLPQIIAAGITATRPIHRLKKREQQPDKDYNDDHNSDQLDERQSPLARLISHVPSITVRGRRQVVSKRWPSAAFNAIDLDSNKIAKIIER